MKSKVVTSIEEKASSGEESSEESSENDDEVSDNKKSKKKVRLYLHLGELHKAKFDLINRF